MASIAPSLFRSALQPAFCPTCQWNTAGIDHPKAGGARICSACSQILYLPPRDLRFSPVVEPTVDTGKPFETLSLEECRIWISQLDQKILVAMSMLVELFAERNQVVNQVGEIKTAEGMPILNENVEAVKLVEITIRAIGLRVDFELARKVLTLIMEDARLRQTVIRRSHSLIALKAPQG